MFCFWFWFRFWFVFAKYRIVILTVRFCVYWSWSVTLAGTHATPPFTKSQITMTQSATHDASGMTLHQQI
jgi:hypothetical protein